MSALAVTADLSQLDLLNKELGLYARLSGKTAGYLERGPGFLRIVGLSEGLAEVDSRYGIVDRAVGTVRADMAPYIERKLVEGMQPFSKLKAS